MSAQEFLKQHLRRSELPDTIPVETVIAAIEAAQRLAIDQTSDFDEDRIQNLRRALKTIEDTSKDQVACLTAKRALLNDEELYGE